MASVKTLQLQLLEWYDRHKRVMPWRARKGARPDPYHVWLSEVMLQQTTVATVGVYFLKFIEKWPRVQDLAAADLDDVLTAWAGLGYYARARNLHKCARVVAQAHGGKFPQEEAALLELPGIGPYTAAAIASIAFDREATAVDGNVERVVARFFNLQTPLPAVKTEIRSHAARLTKAVARPGDFTQALMELGATVCTPRKPQCGICPWRQSCAARKAGTAEDLPRRAPRPEKPVRHGVAVWSHTRDGRFLIRRRAEKGLLGGMYEIPSTPWTEKQPPLPSGARLLEGTVRHTFTHFHLILQVAALACTGRTQGEGRWIRIDEIENYALPTVMRKVVNLAAGQTLRLK